MTGAQLNVKQKGEGFSHGEGLDQDEDVLPTIGRKIRHKNLNY